MCTGNNEIISNKYYTYNEYFCVNECVYLTLKIYNYNTTYILILIILITCALCTVPDNNKNIFEIRQKSFKINDIHKSFFNRHYKKLHFYQASYGPSIYVLESKKIRLCQIDVFIALSAF